MRYLTLTDGVLQIHEMVFPLEKLSNYLEKSVSSPEKVIFWDQERYQYCREFMAAHRDDEILKVKMNHWSESTLSLFPGIIAKIHPHIREIDLSNANLRDADIPQIITLIRTFPELKEVNLKGNYISNDGAIALARTLLDCENMTRLNLSDNDIGYATCQFIEEQIRLFTTAKIDLSENQQADEIVRAQQQLLLEESVAAREYLGELADEFHNGDLLYGLHAGVAPDKGRNPAHDALRKVLMPQEHHQLVIINPFSDWVLNRNNFEGAYKKQLIRFKDFLDDIVPSLLPKDEEPFIQGWSEHKIICKLGLIWAKKNDKKVHYVLDDLNMEQFSSSHRNRADTSVTESEIKFIARFYEHIKDNVQFWRTDKSTGKMVKVAPPWLDPETKHHWDSYLEAQQRKMKFFPKVPPNKDEVIQMIADRKQYSAIAYHAAFEALFRNVIAKSSDGCTQVLVEKYLTKLYEADTKHKLEKLVFDLADEYKEYSVTFKDENLESLLKNLVVTAKTYQKADPSDRFFFRRPMQERLFGTKVLDMQALFRLAAELEQPKELGADLK